MPPPEERSERMASVLHVLYLIFNEGSTASSGSSLHRVELTSEAIRLTRQLHDLLPDDGEVAGLLALMLLTDARRPARARPDGALVPLAEQDRSPWDAEAIAEGVGLSRALASAPIGPYQLQAAIAAVHDEAARFEDTDWRQILGLYGLLDHRAGTDGDAQPHRRGRDGPRPAGRSRPARRGRGRSCAGRAPSGRRRPCPPARDGRRPGGGARAYRLAARRTLSIPEQRYLESRARRSSGETR